MATQLIRPSASHSLSDSGSSSEMDASDVTRMVYSRVQNMDPENASKIMRYLLLLQESGEKDMLCLAFGPDSNLQALVNQAKKELGLLPLSQPSSSAGVIGNTNSPFHLVGSHLSASNEYFNSLYLGSGGPQSPFNRPSHLHSSDDIFYQPAFDALSYHERNSPYAKIPFFAPEQLIREEPHDFLDLPYPSPDIYSLNSSNNNKLFDSFQQRSSGSISSLSDLSPEAMASAWKPCLYFARGYCKHGTNCKFLHSPMRFDPASLHSSGQREYSNLDSLPVSSLERLEMELQELLRGRRTPVSIASLPQLYYERFGRTLQADGYLTESQRHGKAGYSLTKLLARLKNTVTLIDRPHGQHAVVLAEDAQRFVVFREIEDHCGINPGSRQIYLTFPAESTFSEAEVSEHFRTYGPVQDVRIPYQQKRMFGFVTFIYSETVKTILSKGNPHYICGSRVLVKPYKEKGKHNERKLVERGEHSKYASPKDHESRDFDFSPGVRFYGGSDPFLVDYEVDQSQSLLALDRRRIQQFHSVIQPPLSSASYSGETQHLLSNGITPIVSQESARISEDLSNLQSSGAFSYLLDVLDSDTGGEDLEPPPSKPITAHQSDGEHNLPESPFASPPSHGMEASSILSDQLKALSLLSTVEEEENNSSTNNNNKKSSHFLTFSLGNELQLRCRICLGFMVDPIQLDCTHTFCVQCILKVIRVSKDECPVCLRAIGSQIARLMESRGHPVIIDPSVSNRAGGQIVW